MPKFVAVFVGLTTRDFEGRPATTIPDGDGVTFFDEIRLSPAGAAAGAVVNAAKLGASTAAVAGVGADEKGDFILDVYRRLGIDCSVIQRTDKSPTSATILPIRPNDERPAFHRRGDSDRLFVVEQDVDPACAARLLRSNIQTRDGEFQTPAFRVAGSSAVGRRDGNRGGFIGGLAEGLDLEGARRLGAAAPSPATTGLGSEAGARDRQQVRAFMKTAEPLQ
jgi:sugar/nucleoside kinase (ribokinase family)